MSSLQAFASSAEGRALVYKLVSLAGPEEVVRAVQQHWHVGFDVEHVAALVYGSGQSEQAEAYVVAWEGEASSGNMQKFEDVCYTCRVEHLLTLLSGGELDTAFSYFRTHLEPFRETQSGQDRVMGLDRMGFLLCTSPVTRREALSKEYIEGGARDRRKGVFMQRLKEMRFSSEVPSLELPDLSVVAARLLGVDSTDVSPIRGTPVPAQAIWATTPTPSSGNTARLVEFSPMDTAASCGAAVLGDVAQGRVRAGESEGNAGSTTKRVEDKMAYRLNEDADGNTGNEAMDTTTEAKPSEAHERPSLVTYDNDPDAMIVDGTAKLDVAGIPPDTNAAIPSTVVVADQTDAVHSTDTGGVAHIDLDGALKTTGSMPSMHMKPLIRMEQDAGLGMTVGNDNDGAGKENEAKANHPVADISPSGDESETSSVGVCDAGQDGGAGVGAGEGEDEGEVDGCSVEPKVPEVTKLLRMAGDNDAAGTSLSHLEGSFLEIRAPSPPSPPPPPPVTAAGAITMGGAGDDMDVDADAGCVSKHDDGMAVQDIGTQAGGVHNDEEEKQKYISREKEEVDCGDEAGMIATAHDQDNSTADMNLSGGEATRNATTMEASGSSAAMEMHDDTYGCGPNTKGGNDDDDDDLSEAMVLTNPVGNGISSLGKWVSKVDDPDDPDDDYDDHYITAKAGSLFTIDDPQRNSAMSGGTPAAGVVDLVDGGESEGESEGVADGEGGSVGKSEDEVTAAKGGEGARQDGAEDDTDDEVILWNTGLGDSCQDAQADVSSMSDYNQNSNSLVDTAGVQSLPDGSLGRLSLPVAAADGTPESPPVTVTGSMAPVVPVTAGKSGHRKNNQGIPISGKGEDKEGDEGGIDVIEVGVDVQEKGKTPSVDASRGEEHGEGETNEKMEKEDDTRAHIRQGDVKADSPESISPVYLGDDSVMPPGDSNDAQMALSHVMPRKIMSPVADVVHIEPVAAAGAHAGQGSPFAVATTADQSGSLRGGPSLQFSPIPLQPPTDLPTTIMVNGDNDVNNDVDNNVGNVIDDATDATSLPANNPDIEVRGHVPAPILEDAHQAMGAVRLSKSNTALDEVEAPATGEKTMAPKDAAAAPQATDDTVEPNVTKGTKENTKENGVQVDGVAVDVVPGADVAELASDSVAVGMVTGDNMADAERSPSHTSVTAAAPEKDGIGDVDMESSRPAVHELAQIEDPTKPKAPELEPSGGEGNERHQIDEPMNDRVLMEEGGMESDQACAAAANEASSMEQEGFIIVHNAKPNPGLLRNRALKRKSGGFDKSSTPQGGGIVVVLSDSDDDDRPRVTSKKQRVECEAGPVVTAPIVAATAIAVPEGATAAEPCTAEPAKVVIEDDDLEVEGMKRTMEVCFSVKAKNVDGDRPAVEGGGSASMPAHNRALHERGVIAIQITPNGNRLVTCCREGVIKMSEVDRPYRKQHKISKYKHVKAWPNMVGNMPELLAGPIRDCVCEQVHVTKNNSFFATSRHDRLIVGKLGSESIIIREQKEVSLKCITCSSMGESDCNAFVFGTAKGEVVYYNFKTKKVMGRTKLCDSSVRSIRISPNLKHVMATTDDGQTHQLSVQESQQGSASRHTYSHSLVSRITYSHSVNDCASKPVVVGVLQKGELANFVVVVNNTVCLHATGIADPTIWRSLEADEVPGETDGAPRITAATFRSDGRLLCIVNHMFIWQLKVNAAGCVSEGVLRKTAGPDMTALRTHPLTGEVAVGTSTGRVFLMQPLAQ